MENKKNKNSIVNNKVKTIKNEILAQIPDLRGKPAEDVKQVLIGIISKYGITPEQLKSLSEPKTSISLDNLGVFSFKNMLSNIDSLAGDISENNLDENGKKKNTFLGMHKKHVKIKFSEKEISDIQSSSKEGAKIIIENRLTTTFFEAGYTVSDLQKPTNQMKILDAKDGKCVDINCAGQNFLDASCEMFYHLLTTKDLDKVKEESEKTFGTAGKTHISTTKNNQQKTETQDELDMQNMLTL